MVSACARKLEGQRAFLVDNVCFDYDAADG